LSAPRINCKKKHLLIDIVILRILAVLSGAESWDAIELYGNENRGVFQIIVFQLVVVLTQRAQRIHKENNVFFFVPFVRHFAPLR
jgi:hypothetical protein